MFFVGMSQCFNCGPSDDLQCSECRQTLQRMLVEVRDSIARVKKADADGDYETAHSYEDAMLDEFIADIAIRRPGYNDMKNVVRVAEEIAAFMHPASDEEGARGERWYA